MSIDQLILTENKVYNNVHYNVYNYVHNLNNNAQNIHAIHISVHNNVDNNVYNIYNIGIKKAKPKCLTSSGVFLTMGNKLPHRNLRQRFLL